MKHIALLTLMTLFLFAPSVNAEGLIEVELIDGTVVSGKLVSFYDGVYTIDSATLGTLEINETNVRELRSKSSATEAQSDISTQTGIQALQQRMLADEEIMQMITALLQDPDFQEVLQDEELMRAISSGDLNALKSNPKLQKLMDKAAVKQIEGRLDK